MLHTLAQAAVTVTETVTNTPPPTVPVEIIKQPSSGWELKDFLALLLTAVSVLFSIAAFGFSRHSWKHDGPLPRAAIVDYPIVDSQLRPCVWYQVVNRGRMAMPVGAPVLIEKPLIHRVKANPRIFDCEGTFPTFDEYCEGEVKLFESGSGAWAQFPLAEIKEYAQEWGIAVSKLRIVVHAGNRKLYTKFPKGRLRPLVWCNAC